MNSRLCWASSRARRSSIALGLLASVVLLHRPLSLANEFLVHVDPHIIAVALLGESAGVLLNETCLGNAAWR
jgi:hypothetical protein